MFCLGFDQAWSSPAIPSLKKEQRFNLTETDFELITSITPIGSFLGCLCVGALTAVLGRRGAVLALSPLYIGSYFLIGFAIDPAMIVVGRFICGFLAGVASPAAQIYISEVSSPNIRGRLASLTGVFLTAGILGAYSFGAFLNWRQLTFIAITFPALLGLFAIVIPESPVWYIMKQRNGCALNSLQKLRGSDADVNGEFKIKKENYERINSMPSITLRNVSDPKFWKPLALSSMLMIFQQLSGNLAVVFNTVAIFESTGSTLSPTISSVVSGSVMVIFTVGATFLIDKAGRKILLLLSSAGMAISLLILGIYFYIQIYSALSVGLAMFCLGFDQAWSSPAIPSLKKEVKFNLTETDLEIIASINPAGSFLGALCVGMLITSLGRRGTVMALSPLYIGSYLLTGFAVNPIMIIIGRFICGFLAGAASPASQIYVSEISSPCVRGRLASLAGIFLTAGILVAYGFGAFLSWNQLSFFGILFPALLGLSTLFIPESPVWYVIKQKDSLALRSLQQLRGRTTDIRKEFNIKKESSERIKNMPKITLRNAIDPKFWKPLALSSMLMISQQFSGNLAVVFNTVSIFESTGSTLSPSLSSVITGSVMVIFTIGMTFMIDRAGRKALLLISSAGMGLSHSLLGSYFYVQANYPQDAIDSLSWLPLVSLVTFFIFYALGYNGIPFMMLGELLPLRYRGICSSLSGAVNRLFAVIVVMTFPLMQDTFGKYGCYWFYSACCCFSTVSVFFLLPETKGKSLEEIESLFDPHFTNELIDGIDNKAFKESDGLNSKF